MAVKVIGCGFSKGRCVPRNVLWEVVSYMETLGKRDCQWASMRLTEDYLSRQFVTKWDSPNGERELATARTTSLLVELLGVPAYVFVDWMCESGRHGEFQETMGNLQYGY